MLSSGIFPHENLLPFFITSFLSPLLHLSLSSPLQPWSQVSQPHCATSSTRLVSILTLPFLEHCRPSLSTPAMRFLTRPRFCSEFSALRSCTPRRHSAALSPVRVAELQPPPPPWTSGSVLCGGTRSKDMHVLLLLRVFICS